MNPIVTLIALAALLCGPVSNAGQNVLFIAIDDLNDWIGGLGGHPQAKTPHLDALARRGVLFRNAHCNAPVCGPSRVSLMTGIRPSDSGNYVNEQHAFRAPGSKIRDAVTLPQHFGGNGYATLGCGKLFHASDGQENFQTYGPAGSQGPLPRRPLSRPPEQSTSALWDWGVFPKREGNDYPDIADARWTAARLGEPRDQPFFLGCGFYRPHVPLYAPQRFYDLHPLDQVQLPEVLKSDRDDIPPFALELIRNPLPPEHRWFAESGQWRNAVQAYLACVSFTDENVGTVMAALDAGPHADNTWIVLFSDHGFFLGEKQHWAKRALWDRATRVPLIIVPPKNRAGEFAAGKVCDRPVELLSLYPTLIEACGLPRLPDQVGGASLIPLLKDPQAGWPHVAITSHTAGNHAVRDERFRYIRYADGSQELYDLRNDPAEWKNLAGDSAMNGVIGRLATALPATEAGPLPPEPGKGKGKGKPNIVLIMADDIGMECLSAYGGESHRTPHLDALAASGLRFQNAHSQPICTPSRVQLMTGIHNNRNYLRFGVLDPQAATFGNRLRDAGYRTAIGGKWQLDGGFEAPGRFGFDRHCLWQLTRRPSRYSNPGLEIDGKESDFKNGEFGPDVVTDYLCKFMEENKDGPFFVYYPMMLPHWPFVPTPDHPDYDPEMWRQAKNEPGGFHGPEYWPAMVSYTDKMVGKMVRKIEELGIRDNTLILWTGDNGTYNKLSTRFRGRDYPGGKGSTRDNGTHVGLIASWPAVIEPGRTSDALVDFTDILPTVVETAGAKIPDGIDGISLAPVFRGEPRAKDFIYCWYARDGERDKASQHVRDARHKLYMNGKFFDVAADPEEKNPLVADDLPAQLRETRARLQAGLDRHLAITRLADPVQAKRRAALKRGGNPGGPEE